VKDNSQVHFLNFHTMVLGILTVHLIIWNRGQLGNDKYVSLFNSHICYNFSVIVKLQEFEGG